MPPVSRAVGKLLICDDVTPFDAAVTSATSFHGESASKVIELTTSANKVSNKTNETGHTNISISQQ